jgi:hypothetical protein
VEEPETSYEEVIHGLSTRWRPTPRRVFIEIFKSPRRSLSDVAAESDDVAATLESTEPPADAQAEHDELVESLRQVAGDAREIAARRRMRLGYQMLRELRGKPSHGRFVEAWRAVRERLKE